MTMRLSRWLLPVVASSLLAAGPVGAQSRPMLIPGLPVPVLMPAGALAGAPLPPVPAGAATGPANTVPTQSGMGAVPPGSVDGNGYLTQPFMRAEAESLLNELVNVLPADKKAKVQGIPFAFDAQTSEFNAYAGCENGSPFMAMTLPLLRTVGHIAEAKAADEVFGTQRTPVYTRTAAQAMSDSAAAPDPPAGFYTLQEANDPRKLGRQRVIFDEMVSYVLGHEIAHHYLGHTGCANGQGSGGLDPTALLRLPSQAIPVFNQPIEAAADTNGVTNLLDLGVNRQGGLTEQGAILTLQFFGALQQVTPSSLLLGVLRTHPQPQLRIPLVQQAAQQWRQRRASGQPTNPSGAGAGAFPFPIPFLQGR